MFGGVKFQSKANIFFLITLLLATGTLFVPFVSATQPLSGEQIENLKARGEYENWVKSYLETGNHLVHPSLAGKLEYKLNKIKRDAAGFDSEIYGEVNRLFPPGKTTALPSSGKPKTFALLIEFNDYSHTIEKSVFEEVLYGQGSAGNYPLESLSNFYHRSSYGMLDLSDGDVLGWYHFNFDRDSVVPETASRENLIKQALNHYDSLGHDFSRYDNDGDGYIDFFMVFYAGPNNSGFWWGSYFPGWADGDYRIDGKKLRCYSWQWEDGNPSTPIHETGHALGLPDYYDFVPDVGPGGGVGYFDMMHSKADHNCFSKWLLDWVTPTVITGGEQTIVLNDSSTSPDCVLIWPDFNDADPFTEFFMVQNRQWTGNDSAYTYPIDGLAIFHVDATLNENGTFAYNNSDTSRKLLRIMEADGLEELENSVCIDPPENDGDPLGTCSLDPNWECGMNKHCKVILERDLYNESDRFTPESFPTSDDYTGLSTDVRVWGILDHGDSLGSAISAIFGIVPLGDCGQVPQPVQLSLPENGALDVSPTPHLGWFSQPGTAGYLVQVCDTETCENPTIVQRVQLNNWVVSPPLQNLTQYWWRVKARNFCNFGNWSPIYTFTTGCPELETPEQILPQEGSLDVALRPTLNWTQVSAPHGYTVQVCKTENCLTPVRQSTQIANHWIATPELDVGTRYYWRVKANSDCRLENWSPIGTFTTTCTTLEHPNLLSPPFGSTDRYTSLTMDWADQRHAVDYVVQVCRDEECNSVIQEHTTEQSDWYNSWDTSTTYWWRVKARNACGESPWSPAWVFSTEFRPEPARLLVPIDTATGVSPTPFLDWQPVDGAVQYQVFVRDCGQDSGCGVTTGSSYWVSESRLTLTSPLDKGDFHRWYVMTYVETNSGELSEKWVFQVCEDPVTPVLSSPADGEADVAIPTVLDWSATQGAVSYDVQVCNDDRCTVVLRSENVLNASQWTVSPGLSSNTGYYWRVKANNACGESLWSSKWSFTTTNCPVPTFQPHIKTPVDGQTGVSVLPTLEWQGSGAGMPTYFGPFEVWLCSDIHCKTPVLQQNNVAGWSYTPETALNQNTGYWWQVRAANICGHGPWSARPGFTTGDCSTLPAPSINDPGREVDSRVDYTVEWTADRNASDYTVQESIDPSFTQADNFTQTGISKTFNHTVHGCSPRTYHYRVRANKSGCGPGEWSDVVDMTVKADGTLTAPIPASPADNATDVSLTPMLDWEDTPDAVLYLVEVCDDKTCSSITESSKVSESTWTPSSSLAAQTDYWWRVRAGGNSPCNDSDWSSIRRFTTSCKPNTPVLQDPGENVTPGQTYTIGWPAVPGADSYILWESRNVEMHRATSYSTTKTSVDFSHMNNRCVPVTYYYAVQAVKMSCPTGDLSNLVDMKIDSPAAPPAPASLDYPVGDCSGTFTVTWTSVSGAEIYFLERSTDGMFTDSQTVYSGNSTSFNETGQPAGSYYYRVKSANGCWESPWLEGSIVNVGGPVPGIEYVGTGNCNDNYPCHQLLNSAVDSVITPGTVHVMEGEYPEDCLLNIPKELQLIGWDSTYSTPSEIMLRGCLEIGSGGIAFSGGCFVLCP